MKNILRNILVLGWIPTLMVAASVRGFGSKPALAAERTPVTITRLYTGADQKTHAEEITVPLPLKPANGASERSEYMAFTGAQWVRTSTSYDLDWHPAPRRQYIINLDAGVRITASDGEARVIGAGEVLLVEDTHGKGHLSQAIEGKMRHSIFIPVD